MALKNESSARPFQFIWFSQNLCTTQTTGVDWCTDRGLPSSLSHNKYLVSAQCWVWFLECLHGWRYVLVACTRVDTRTGKMRGYWNGGRCVHGIKDLKKVASARRVMQMQPDTDEVFLVLVFREKDWGTFFSFLSILVWNEYQRSDRPINVSPQMLDPSLSSFFSMCSTYASITLTSKEGRGRSPLHAPRYKRSVRSKKIPDLVSDEFGQIELSDLFTLLAEYVSTTDVLLPSFTGFFQPSALLPDLFLSTDRTSINTKVSHQR